MRRRDAIWRGAGAAVFAGCCAGAQLRIGGDGVILLYLLSAIAAIVIMLKGHHVVTFIRAERRGHGLTAQAIHMQRLRRHAEHPSKEG